MPNAAALRRMVPEYAASRAFQFGLRAWKNDFSRNTGRRFRIGNRPEHCVGEHYGRLPAALRQDAETVGVALAQDQCLDLSARIYKSGNQVLSLDQRALFFAPLGRVPDQVPPAAHARVVAGRNDGHAVRSIRRTGAKLRRWISLGPWRSSSARCSGVG